MCTQFTLSRFSFYRQLLEQLNDASLFPSYALLLKFLYCYSLLLVYFGQMNYDDDNDDELTRAASTFDNIQTISTLYIVFYRQNLLLHRITVSVLVFTIYSYRIILIISLTVGPNFTVRMLFTNSLNITFNFYIYCITVFLLVLSLVV